MGRDPGRVGTGKAPPTNRDVSMIRLPLRSALIACLAMAALARGADDPPYDLILTGGRVVDGTGNAWFLGDVAIRGDTIARITPAGHLGEAPTKKRVDASGLVV